MPPSIKQWIFSLGQTTGTFALGRKLTRSSLRVFTWHGVQNIDDPVLNLDCLQVSPGLFYRQIRWIRDHFQVLDPKTLANGQPWPDQSALLTFDDGYRNNLTEALPVLQACGLPALFFVSTAYVEGSDFPWWYRLRWVIRHAGKPVIQSPEGDRLPLSTLEDRRSAALCWESFLVNRPQGEQMDQLAKLEIACQPDATFKPCFEFLTPDDLKHMIDAGMTLGFHGHQHLAYGVEAPDVIRQDHERSVRCFDAWQLPVAPLLAYPYGSLPLAGSDGERFSLGIQSAFTTQMGINPPGGNGLYLKRFDVNGGRNPANLAAISSGLYR
ncbi:MAG: polysaccharide deacetylase family protein [Kiritimatiellae bacterium]|nr:polysaccharide deacetylase family protein [Kiritimatiellia bacterium]